MKFGNLEFSGITRVVQNRKILWLREKNRWIKYIPVFTENIISTGEPVGGMSVIEMHRHIEKNMTDGKHRVTFNGNTINIYRKV